MKKTVIDFDLGFATEEFRGNERIIAYAQFLNPYKTPHWGLAIKKKQAEIAGFVPDSTWKPVDHKFKGSEQFEKLYLCVEPRILILNRSRLMKCSPDGKVSLYDHSTDHDLPGTWKRYTYMIVWFLGANKQPLSALPFRLRISGQAGMSFINNYRNYVGTSCFCDEFFKLYKQLNPTDRDNSKNNLFWAHAIYKPIFAEKEAKSRLTGECSDVCMTVGFVRPTRENFLDLVIRKNKDQELSDRILEQVEKTKVWIKFEQISKEETNTFNESQNNESESNISSSSNTISDKQARRLFAISKLKKIKEADYYRYLNCFGYEFDYQIKREDYDEMVDSIENNRYLEILKINDPPFDDLPF